MQAKAARGIFLIFVVLLSMILMVGCAGMKKTMQERSPGYLYYPSALVDADQALREARAADKDKTCPDEFNAAKDMVDKAYEIYMSSDKWAIAMAQDSIGKTKALCPPKPVAEMKPEPKPELKPEPLLSPPPPLQPPPVTFIPAVKAPKLSNAKKYKEYKAVLGADSVITMSEPPGPPGRLRVWIGIPDYKPNFPENMVQATGTLPTVGVTAKITPDAPAFKVEPKESDCIQIHPTGSEVGFRLTPIEEGIFDVGADVQLYDSSDCSGTPIPKATTTLQVKVIVDHKKEEKKKEEEHQKKFWEIFWDEVFKFWKALLVLFFAVIIFLMRKQLKKWVGFGNDN